MTSTETNIYYSKLRLALIPGVMGAMGVVVAILYDDGIIGLGLIAVALIYLMNDFGKLAWSGPVIVLNDRGIKIRDKEYYWSEIRSERAILETLGANRSWSYLTFDTSMETVKIDIKNCNIDIDELNNKLTIYRERSGANRSTNVKVPFVYKLSIWGNAGRYVAELLGRKD